MPMYRYESENIPTLAFFLLGFFLFFFFSCSLVLTETYESNASASAPMLRTYILISVPTPMFRKRLSKSSEYMLVSPAAEYGSNRVNCSKK